jgi:16S rRNA (guanine966-N2)-methyltransferase
VQRVLKRKSKLPGKIRIIGGQWRGRMLKVVAHSELRPTPDRVRETLFNWLTGYINEARCLDLFAGTGVLGFEALSRGAKEVVFVDHHVPVVKALFQTAQDLDALSRTEIILNESLRWLKQVQHESAPFDVIFLDPPYSSMLVKSSIRLLAESSLVHPQTLIYAESPTPLVKENIPQHWELIKEKTASEVVYHLLRGSKA